MDRLCGQLRRYRKCCPHACGGGPIVSVTSIPGLELSPRMWGWTGHGCSGDREIDVVPTHVGVDRRQASGKRAKCGCPHACGGGPEPVGIKPKDLIVVPTHVGVDRSRHYWLSLQIRCPHACGGGPGTAVPATAKLMLSPRMWGWTAGRPTPKARRFVVPTHVGVDREAGTGKRTSSSCPHACGGGPAQGHPVRAGIDLDRDEDRFLRVRSPRTRGDRSTEGDATVAGITVPPYARG